VSRLRSRFQRHPRGAREGAAAAASAPGSRRPGKGARRRPVFAPSDRTRRARLGVLVAAVLAGLAGLAARCVHLQVIRAPALLEQARAQHERAIDLDPQRGPILDRNGHELALSLAVDSVFADPSQVGDAAAAARRLGPVLGLSPGALRERLEQGRHFVWLKRKIDPDLRKRIEALGLPGVSFVRETRRFYPKRDLAGHAIGACGVDNQGLAGLEFAFNERFTGTPGRLQFVRDGKGGRVLDRSRVEPVPGQGVVLTLDEAIQHIAERELDAAMRDTGAQGAAIVVLRPLTGEILALASRPGFDPNAYAKAGEPARRNRAVSDFYEPGSTFKVITAAAALDAGKVRPGEVIFCENGSYVVARHRYREDRLPYGDLTFTEVLAKSSNIGTIKVAQRLRSTDFHATLLRFGFGSETPLELPGESPGLLRDVDHWSGLSHASIAMGQEVGVTPIQLAAAVGTLANDGIYSPPRLVETFTKPDGRRLPPDGEARSGSGRRAVSAQAARTLRRMLESVTSDGTGTAARVPGYSTGGKTGTAQKIDPATGRYARGRYVAWFAGFVPAGRPELVIVVMVDEPRGARFHGGDVAAPVFSRVALPVLQYLGVPPDREPALIIDAPLRASAPRRTGRVVPAVRRRGVPADAARAGKADGPGAGVEAAILGPMAPDAASGPSMPDLTGLTLRQATERLAALGLNCSSQRRGPRVKAQDPGPGSPVRGGDRCAISYE
jgi:cell division protein FtsI (penicillin-binding protein 3)